MVLADSRLALALEPGQIVLVVNSAVPESRKLADFYAQQRQIPPGHIVELQLPTPVTAFPAEDISAADYDEKVLPVIKNFLTQNALDQTVTCLVTFWGVPLRIGPRPLAEADKNEVAELKVQYNELIAHIDSQVKIAEGLAAQFDPGFHPARGSDLDSLARRADASLTAVVRHMLKMEEQPAKRSELYEQVMAIVKDLGGQPAVTDKMAQPDIWELAPTKPTSEEIQAGRQRTAELQRQVESLQNPNNSENRARLRELFKAELGSLNSARLVLIQSRLLDNVESQAAFDSELALLWWPNYPKYRWVINPLDWKSGDKASRPQHTLMVMRLDGPSVQTVHDLIETSIRVEKEGLRGEVVLDARGKPPTEPYGVYDQTIRNLAELLQAKSKLKVVLDNKETLIPENSEQDIAIYCGWYKLHHYVSPGKFNPGAVGFHIASAEMVSLHNPSETGWCRNLLNAGVTATVGPVAEPYLQSFPPADEFFPLLMTGKLQLAEVYWKTTPWASWMQCAVGDPLYTPYRVNPALKREDLEPNLRQAVP